MVPSTSISAAEDKPASLPAEIKGAVEKLSQLKEEKTFYDSTIAAITKAVAALEKGVAGGFLLTSAAAFLRKVIRKKTIDMEKIQS